MSESAKPFACTVTGCSMSFVNEDHLTVHKKKHDMMLNLGINNKSNFFLADQTPTPTRFIRNCDEVSLFQDLHSDNPLHNDNPFEETFRRAVEEGKNGVLSVPEINENDDTLHTPNIFPHISEECTPLVSTTYDKSIELEPLITLEIVKNKNEATKNSTRCDNNDSNDSIATIPKDDSVHNILHLPIDHKSIKSETHVPINTAEMQLLLKTEDGKVLRFISAPVGDDVNSVNFEPKLTKPLIIPNNNSNKPDNKVISNQKLSMAKMKLKQTLTRSGIVIENKFNKNNDNTPVNFSKDQNKVKIDPVKKLAIMERNRASSMRARAKRKAWIEQLQDSLKLANETNANLHAQLKNLHGQIAKLKTLLLAHKDCSVTKAMEKGNGVVVSSKVIAIKPNIMKTVPIVSTDSIKSTKRASTEKVAMSNKKSIILPNLISSIIIPTSNLSSNTITLHAAEETKPVPTFNIVTPLVTNTENGKNRYKFFAP